MRVLPWAIGATAAVGAWFVVRHRMQQNHRHTIPVRVAAEQLQQAWADYHTVA
jgi:hypothetical protein